MLHLNWYLLLSTVTAGAAAMALTARRAWQRRAWAVETARAADAGRAERDRHRQALGDVTGGRLRLCEPDEVQALLTGERLWTLPLLEPGDVSVFRRHLRALAARRGFAEARLDDLCGCVSEAAANAIRHSQGGVAQVWAEADGLTILVTDCGPGISAERLLGRVSEGASESAASESAASEREAEGLGFRLMLAMSDLLALSTGPNGTQLLLKVRNLSVRD